MEGGCAESRQICQGHSLYVHHLYLIADSIKSRKRSKVNECKQHHSIANVWSYIYGTSNIRQAVTINEIFTTDMCNRLTLAVRVGQGQM